MLYLKRTKKLRLTAKLTAQKMKNVIEIHQVFKSNLTDSTLKKAYRTLSTTSVSIYQTQKQTKTFQKYLMKYKR